MNRRLPALIVYGALGYFAAFLDGAVSADHAERWPIVKERQLEEGTTKACIYHRVERCAGLSAPLPRFARVASEPCPHDPSRWCLPGTQVSGGYDPVHKTIILASGNDRDGDEALRHEFIHHLRCETGRDCFDHNGVEWACQ